MLQRLHNHPASIGIETNSKFFVQEPLFEIESLSEASPLSLYLFLKQCDGV